MILHVRNVTENEVKNGLVLKMSVGLERFLVDPGWGLKSQTQQMKTLDKLPACSSSFRPFICSGKFLRFINVILVHRGTSRLLTVNSREMIECDFAAGTSC